MYQDFKNKLLFVMLMFCVTLICYLLFRFIILYSYNDIFLSLTNMQIIYSFFYGIRFDLSIISIIYMPFFLLFLLPIKSKKLADMLIGVILILFFIQIIVLIADFIYFPEAKRHISDELSSLWNDRMFIVDYVIDKFLIFVISLLMSFLIISYYIIKLFNYVVTYKKVSFSKNITVILTIMVLLFLMFRGRLTDKPLNITDIYKMSNNISQATLALNPVFTSIHTLRKKQSSLINSYPIDKAFDISRTYLISKEEQFVDLKYPLVRQIVNNNKKTNKYNIFIILLESWAPKYIDGYSHGNYNVTPNMDKIISESIIFTNAYATGVRSIFGISATFAGVSLVPGLQHFAYGLELNNICSISDIVDKNVYYTAFMQSSKRESYQLCDIAKNIFHVDETFGKEDMPNLMNYIAAHHFGYDYDLLMFASNKSNEMHVQKKNFFIFSFTGTTHTPFNSTIEQFNKYPRINDENKYLNTLFYSDYSIGKLIEKSKKEGWFDDTIFIFLSDHNLNTVNKTDNIKEKFHIPFIIYAPKIFKHKKIDYTVSQLDVIPTISHILNVKKPFVALGKNALDETTEHFAFITEGTNIAIIKDNYYMKHNRKNVLETNTKKNSKEYYELEKLVLSLDKATTETFKHNIWYR